LKRKSAKRWLFEVGLCLGTAAVTAVAMWWFLPLWLAGSYLAVLMIHEMAHYLTALRLGMEVDLPVFVPLIIAVFGFTHMKFGNDLSKLRKVALAGPIAGMAAATILAVLAYVYAMMPMFWACLWLLAFQIWGALLGSDGRKYRAFRRAQRKDTSDAQTDKVAAMV